MDSDTLQTASTYLNNLLQARGLLRNGKPLDFAKPTRDTRAQTINLVHDLLLRRDRDQDSREHVANTLRTLRSEQSRKDAEITRLQSRLAEKDRILAQAQVETRAAKAETRKIESSSRILQEQVTKLKTLAGQVKTQCATDIKKRDLQIERLKTHLQGQQRGSKSGIVVAPSISISGGSGSSRGTSALNGSIKEVQDPEYSLTQETNEFLTQLSQSLSDENDTLLALVRATRDTLKRLLGLSEQMDLGEDMVASFTDSGQSADVDDMQLSQEVLTNDLQSTMHVLETLLTNPNFVSVEEVGVRDEEIARLREGWERMEARWREMLLMMDGWRKRMEKTGDTTINLADLKMGLGLGDGIENIGQAPRYGSSDDAANKEDSESEDAQSRDGEDSNRDSGVSGFTEDEAMSARKQPVSATRHKARAVEPPEFFDLRPVKGQKLRQLSNNLQSPRRVAFAEEKPKSSSPGQESNTRGVGRTRSSKQPASTTNSTESVSKPPSGLKSGIESPRKNRKRHSSPHPLPAQPLPKYRAEGCEDFWSSSLVEVEVPELSMADKLRVAQIEAEEAKLAEQGAKGTADNESDAEMGDDVGTLRSPAKKTVIKGRPRRRKSTLSPEELESLLGLE